MPALDAAPTAVPTAGIAVAASVAVVAAGAGGWVAVHHPIAPGAAFAAFLLWTLAAWRWPTAWLGVLPAAAPLLGLAPWTGWIVVDEFDLAVAGAIAAAYGRRALDGGRVPGGGVPRRLAALAWLLAGVVAVGLWRGQVDAAAAAAGGFQAGWFQSYADPLNGWRVAKSAVYALLLLPPLARAFDGDPAQAARRLATGMVVGLGGVAAAAVWERSAYPGLLDFGVRYRTVALFWEMHVGGAAIDAWLALAAPFAAWALWRARTPLAWTAAALLALVAGYVCLTTFSRGVYLAVAGPLLLLGGWQLGRRVGFAPRPWLAAAAAAVGAGALVGGLVAWAQAAAGGVGVAALLAAEAALLLVAGRRALLGWRTGAGWLLAAALAVEAVVVLGAGSFMSARVAATERDLGSRVAHWQRGLGLLADRGDRPAASVWADRLFGLGLGRLPARYTAAGGPLGEWPGTLSWIEAEASAGSSPAAAGAPGADGPRGHPRLAGPATSPRLAGLFHVTQRVPLQPVGYRVALVARATAPLRLVASVCEMHLLYERRCQTAAVRLAPADGWQRVDLHLRGPLLDAGRLPAPRLGVFALGVDTAGAAVDLRRASVVGAGDRELLHNGDFGDGLARWFPAVQYAFLPWHIDNLVLELLLERGAVGLLGFAVLFGWALASAVTTSGRQPAGVAPFVAAALVGMLTVGLVSSVMDAPRVAFVFLLLALAAIVNGVAPGRPDGAAAPDRHLSSAP